MGRYGEPNLRRHSRNYRGQHSCSLHLTRGWGMDALSPRNPQYRAHCPPMASSPCHPDLWPADAPVGGTRVSLGRRV